MIDNKTSLLVPYQLPEFVRDNPDYENFTLFVKAYYEWMELSNTANASVTTSSDKQGISYSTKNLLNYIDIDQTVDGFTEYFVNEFLPFFPKESLINKQEAVKIARQLYQIKGTPASYEFLFRVLYNSDFNLFYTKDAVFKASDGQWYITKSLKLNTSDRNFLNIANLRLFGETSKSIATVETAVLSGNKIEVFISNMERTFNSGEFIRVVDVYNQDVYFLNGNIVNSTTSGANTLRAKIVGQVSSVSIDKTHRGNYYSSGDPVILYGGLTSNTGIGATAEVGETQTGSIQRITVAAGGYGYRYSPNTQVLISGGGGSGAKAIVGTLDTDPTGVQNRANVSMIPVDTISFKKDITLNSVNYQFSNLVSANANTRLLDAFTFTSFETYPLSSVLVTSPGGGYRTVPDTSALASYQSDLVSYENGANVSHWPTLSSIGILSPIKITNGGVGYQNNDTIIFSGGTGTGAFANVSVNANGSIVAVSYVLDPQRSYPLGGMGYRNDGLPNISVNSSNVSATGASLYVPAILGTGAVLQPKTDNAGEIVTIKMLNYGEDYIDTPNVSLKVQDIVVSNVYIDNLPRTGDIIFQGVNLVDATYIATVNNVTQLSFNANTQQSLWNLRVFNYNSNPLTTKVLKTEQTNINYVMPGMAFNANYNADGIRVYGDGTAKASAKFLNGLVIGQGTYLSTQGQPSSFSVIQSEDYNNYTYQITVEKEIAKYRDTLLKLLHPTGMKVMGRYAMKTANNTNYNIQNAMFSGHSLRYHTGDATYITMLSDFDNKSNNIIKFNDVPNQDPPLVLSNILIANSTRILITTTNGTYVDAKVISVDNASNTATLDSNVWLTFANVATVTANSGSNTINIKTITGQYDIINNGIYSDVDYPLKDIVFVGDKVLVDNNTSKIVKSIDYANGIITVSSDFTSNANSYLSVNRTFIANTTLNYDQIKLFGPIGTQYVNPQLTAEDGLIITTENEQTLLVG